MYCTLLSLLRNHQSQQQCNWIQHCNTSVLFFHDLHLLFDGLLVCLMLGLVLLTKSTCSIHTSLTSLTSFERVQPSPIMPQSVQSSCWSGDIFRCLVTSCTYTTANMGGTYCPLNWFSQLDKFGTPATRPNLTLCVFSGVNTNYLTFDFRNTTWVPATHTVPHARKSDQWPQTKQHFFGKQPHCSFPPGCLSILQGLAHLARLLLLFDNFGLLAFLPMCAQKRSTEGEVLAWRDMQIFSGGGADPARLPNLEAESWKNWKRTSTSTFKPSRSFLIFFEHLADCFWIFLDAMTASLARCRGTKPGSQPKMQLSMVVRRTRLQQPSRTARTAAQVESTKFQHPSHTCKRVRMHKHIQT